VARDIIFSTKAAQPPASYSQAVRAAGLIFVSGTAPYDPQTGTVVGATIQEQTRQGAKMPVRAPGLKVSIAAVAEA
jgi:2-iminobutanoate/2-iminopropanoate deaminase